ncbi:MAG TPA: pre-16S rRNA-processing nuclease YqgF [Candidatus Nitrosotenuis sp.]|nr:pre-16S rRNA-processing nuclease YqgF [Candidatus Nitrosotenuis sp.]
MRILNLQYDSIMPDDIPNYQGSLIFTTENESPRFASQVILNEEVLKEDPTVIQGIITEKLDSGLNRSELLIGIDPGQRIGISVNYLGKEIERGLYTSPEELASHVAKILGGLKAEQKLVRIGNGNMKVAKQITTQLNLKFCSHFELEFVDERKTTKKIKHYNKRGKRDMLSARFIAQREGYRHYVLPLSRTG